MTSIIDAWIYLLKTLIAKFDIVSERIKLGWRIIMFQIKT